MITSSPAVSNGKVYFGSWDGFLYALNAQTGEEVWKFEVDGFNNRSDGLYKGVSSSPAISDGVIFFGSDQMGGASKELFFYALDAETGEKLWAYSSWNAITSPAVLDRRVYFGGFFEFKGLDIDQGTEVISIGYDTFTITPPAVLDGMAFFGCDFGLLHAVDVNTGTEKWNTFSGDASAISRAPSGADGVVYFSSGHGFLIALDIQTNQILWEYEVGVSITTSPVILDGVIYIGTKEGQLFALEAP
jgi:outer membrane protein assembly factor BamB